MQGGPSRCTVHSNRINACTYSISRKHEGCLYKKKVRRLRHFKRPSSPRSNWLCRGLLSQLLHEASASRRIRCLPDASKRALQSPCSPSSTSSQACRCASIAKTTKARCSTPAPPPPPPLKLLIMRYEARLRKTAANAWVLFFLLGIALVASVTDAIPTKDVSTKIANLK